MSSEKILCNFSEISLSFFVKKFIKCCLMEIEGGRASKKEIWSSFKNWCNDCEIKSLSRKILFHQMEYFFEVNRENVFGVLLKDSSDWEILDASEFSMVYLMSDGNRTKIGYSSNPHLRIGTLQVGSSSDIKIVGLFPGGSSLEADLKKEFDKKKVRGEWFSLSQEDIISILNRFGDFYV